MNRTCCPRSCSCCPWEAPRERSSSLRLSSSTSQLVYCCCYSVLCCRSFNFWLQHASIDLSSYLSMEWVYHWEWYQLADLHRRSTCCYCLRSCECESPGILPRTGQPPHVGSVSDFLSLLSCFVANLPFTTIDQRHHRDRRHRTRHRSSHPDPHTTATNCNCPLHLDSAWMGAQARNRRQRYYWSEWLAVWVAPHLES